MLAHVVQVEAHRLGLALARLQASVPSGERAEVRNVVLGTCQDEVARIDHDAEQTIDRFSPDGDED